MREILFRGKRKDNGQWVEGSLLYDSEQNEGFIAENFEDRAAYIREVIPETVGQYTGLIDKNGKKIFEGDLLKWIDRIVKVVWFELNAQFDCKFVCYANDKIVKNFKGIEPRDWHECDVIGNIHDNPELLNELVGCS